MLFGKQKRHHIITGLDIGTTKVCVIIAQADSEGNPTILGMGSCPSTGLRRGEIVNLVPTVNAIVHAANRAVEVAGVPIGDVYVGVAGEHIQSRNAQAMVEIRHPARGIGFKDRQRAIEKVRHNVPVPDDKALIHGIIQEFRINGGDPTPNPIGLSGSNLSVSAHMVLSDADPLHNIIRCVRRAGLGQPHIVLQSLASSLSVITPTEQELGSVLVDIGGGTTDVAVSVAGSIRCSFEVCQGGDHITRDIAQIFNCSLIAAENAKKRYGCALPQMVERGRTFDLPTSGDAQRLESHEEHLLADVIEARLEEIFHIVRKRLEQSGISDRLHSGVVLSGGTSLLPGITDVAERTFESKCRCGAPQGLRGLATVVKSPIYSTCIGLILYGMDSENQTDLLRDAPLRGRGVRRLLDYLVETFR